MRQHRIGASEAESQFEGIPGTENIASQKLHLTVCRFRTWLAVEIFGKIGVLPMAL